MNKVLVLGVLLAAGCSSVCSSDDGFSVLSPDGKNEIRLSANPLAYEVLRDGKVLVAKTEIGLKVGGRCLKGGKVRGVATCERAGKAASPVYKKAEVDLAAREAFADFGDWGVRLVARNDGVAYRFETEFSGEVTVDCEKAGFALADAKATAYLNRNFGDYAKDPFQNSWESLNETMPAAEAKTPANGIFYLPALFKMSDGTALCVTESDLLDYPGLNLTSAGGGAFCGAFAKQPKAMRFETWGAEPSETKRLRYQRVLSREDFLVKTKGARTFPWRCFLLADAPAKLVENDLVWALATPADKAQDFSWVKPGKVAWDWWNCFDNLGEEKGCTTKGYERFIDFAAKNGVEYVIFDEGWSEALDVWRYSPRVDVPHLIDYANKKGVGIVLWMAWAQVVGEEEKVAAHFAKLGAKGFKVDFMDRDDAACVGFIRKFADACAKHRLLLDYHGMYKPTGLERTCPNVLNFEGVHGLECAKWYGGDYDFPLNDLKDYFVRMSAGPMDYTPGAMDNYAVGTNPPKGGNDPGSVGTRCRQMAMMAMYFAPLQMLCDSPTKYEKNAESFKFMAATPVVWDETVGLAGDPDAFAACARRKGGVWYAAGMTDSKARDFALDTSFLGGGTWTAEIFRDAADSDKDARHYVHVVGQKVKAGEKLQFRLAPGGGFVVRFAK